MKKKKQECYSSVLVFLNCLVSVSKCFYFVFFLALDVMRDLSSLSPMQTRDTLAAASPKTTLALSQETEVKV